MSEVTVIGLGGSIVAPDGVDVGFVRAFTAAITSRLAERPDWRIGLVVGGGSLARRYQAAAREVAPATSAEMLDEVGIAATRVNAALIKAALGAYCPDPVVADPTRVSGLTGRVIIAGGWKPGFSTDNVAVRLAESLGADTLLNLSNIAKVYTSDPKIDPHAEPLDAVSWSDFLKIVGTEWSPGRNTPFDSVATRRAAELSLKVIAADGRDLDNLRSILDGKPYVGTTIGPQ